MYAEYDVDEVNTPNDPSQTTLNNLAAQPGSFATCVGAGCVR